MKKLAFIICLLATIVWGKPLHTTIQYVAQVPERAGPEDKDHKPTTLPAEPEKYVVTTFDTDSDKPVRKEYTTKEFKDLSLYPVVDSDNHDGKAITTAIVYYDDAGEVQKIDSHFMDNDRSQTKEEPAETLKSEVTDAAKQCVTESKK